MAKREIRIRGAATEDARAATMNCIEQYENDYMSKGRDEGFRNGVAFHLVYQRGCTVYVYHTKTAVVGLYREASHAE